MKKMLMILVVMMVVSVYADSTVTTFSGSNKTTTRPFTVKNGWEVQWESIGDLLQIYVHDSSGEAVSIAAVQSGSGKGSSYQAAGGKYYLTILPFDAKFKVKVIQVK